LFWVFSQNLGGFRRTSEFSGTGCHVKKRALSLQMLKRDLDRKSAQWLWPKYGLRDVLPTRPKYKVRDMLPRDLDMKRITRCPIFGDPDMKVRDVLPTWPKYKLPDMLPRDADMKRVTLCPILGDPDMRVRCVLSFTIRGKKQTIF